MINLKIKMFRFRQFSQELLTTLSQYFMFFCIYLIKVEKKTSDFLDFFILMIENKKHTKISLFSLIVHVSYHVFFIAIG